MERVEKLEQTIESLVALPGVVADLVVLRGISSRRFCNFSPKGRTDFLRSGTRLRAHAASCGARSLGCAMS